MCQDLLSARTVCTYLRTTTLYEPCSGCRQGDGEIAASDPHHGTKPVGAPAAHRALARTQGGRAAAILDRYMVPEEVSGGGGIMWRRALQFTQLRRSLWCSLVSRFSFKMKVMPVSERRY